MSLSLFLGILLFARYAQCAAPAGPWDTFNFAPASRSVYPQAVREVYGNVSDTSGLLENGSTTLSGEGSYVTLDFGLEVSFLLIRTVHDI